MIVKNEFKIAIYNNFQYMYSIKHTVCRQVKTNVKYDFQIIYSICKMNKKNMCKCLE